MPFWIAGGVEAVHVGRRSAASLEQSSSAGVYSIMRWRRGIVIAILHLVVAVPLIVYEDARYVRQTRSAHAVDPPLSRLVTLSYEQEDAAIGWEPMTNCYSASEAEQIVRVTNLPAAVISGWHYPPHGTFTIAAAAERLYGPGPSVGAYAVTSAALAAFIFIQWLFIGGLPVVRPKYSWLEPSVLLLVCAAIGAVLLVSEYTRDFSAVPVLVALLTWMAWFVLVVAKVLRFGWRRMWDHNEYPATS